MGVLYGQDIDTTSPNFAPLTDDKQILAQWVTLALSTPEGFYWECPEYGLDLRNELLKPLDPRLPERIRRALVEVPNDGRISGADATVTPTFTQGGAAAFRVTIAITPANASTAPFVLTGLVSGDMADLILRGL